ncbi:hypothetical protein GXP70_22690 [Paenibacillus lycopersici]|uniref:Uncharacterized protein n=1 Tax=Paenibacillus lycopersici TaxID=2704462 RepID=A0A6C0G3D1_9BACL|nr:hypothetical protein [Paenibacillus lycopersici]QHT62513.1 hypothetical protein GXP70_22690 [Paenibacillus lycopersici]
MHGYLVPYTEDKLRQYREADGEFRRLWEERYSASSTARTLGFAAAGWRTLLLRRRSNERRRRDTSLK